ncbi:flavodoxin family protein [Cyclobacterium plantarum]|uniref:Flavodoxin n=1 Tax=Cyclobacterium plantarum TaxID=2716263 RepID=A0ABX0H8H0_9BACT|nr:flavodoxin [Cyclobacterium plantarum]NHE56521.1 flavodoxin [Cyclobacterium plantarum]
MRLFLLFIYLTTALSCSGQTQSEALDIPGEKSSDENLIVYLSRTKNTKAVAEMIQEKVGGALVSLELETPYPKDYDAIVAQVAKENETGILPPLETEVDVSQYRTVFVGFPTWGMQLPPPMKTFLSENDLSGKMVIPFNTNAGYGIGSSFDKVEELCPDSTILEGYSTRGGIERDGVLFVMEGEKEEEVRSAVDDWLNGLGI